MAEEVGHSLQTHKVQLDQVVAALTSDPTNGELLKLKNDLQEVITLTQNLIQSQGASGSGGSSSGEEGGGGGVGSGGGDRGGGSSSSKKEVTVIKAWKVGDRCMAQWSDDSQWYDAVIDAITDDGHVAVTFDGYGNSDVTTLAGLREPIPGEKRPQGGPAPGFSAETDKNKRKMVEAQRQQAKKRKQKKHDRLKQIEEAHEADKAKWLAFSTKVRYVQEAEAEETRSTEAHEADKAKWLAFSTKVIYTKKLKGVTKKSIFATPDAANGRVGIGTCGIGGKPMTEYTHAEKWRKGT